MTAPLDFDRIRAVIDRRDARRARRRLNDGEVTDWEAVRAAIATPAALAWRRGDGPACKVIDIG